MRKSKKLEHPAHDATKEICKKELTAQEQADLINIICDHNKYQCRHISGFQLSTNATKVLTSEKVTDTGLQEQLALHVTDQADACTILSGETAHLSERVKEILDHRISDTTFRNILNQKNQELDNSITR